MFHQKFQRPVAPPARRHLEHAGLRAFPVKHWTDIERLQKLRRAISSARSSIETPVFTRRTFDWLKTSLLNGISREALRVIF